MKRFKTIALSLALASPLFAASIPEDAVYGDFDGDGRKEYLWVECKYDADGIFSTTPILLRSNNKKLDKSAHWKAGLGGVMLENVGRLNTYRNDCLQVAPFGQSTWMSACGIRWNGKKWVTVVKPFQIWTGNDEYKRIYPSKRAGYAIIIYNDMGAGDNAWTNRRKEVRLPR